MMPFAAPGPGVPQVDAQEAKQLLDEGHAVMVDVREPQERVQARIPGSVFIPLMQVGTRVDELPKDKTLVMQCHSGQRSQHAARVLQAAGYEDVVNLAGGIIGWHQAGLPIEQGPE